MSSVYLDYNATTPIDPEVVEAISKSLKEDWGNPSSGHELGLIARKKIEIAREHLAKGIGAATSQIIFTSGGTEALNWAINSCCSQENDEEECHVVTSALEHCAVLNPLKKLAPKCCQVDYVRPANGRFAVTSDQIIKQITNKTRLVAVMLANNETGAIQPAEKIGDEILKLKENGHKVQYLDASQCFGKIPISVENIKCDYLILAGHKFYGPRIGALYARDQSKLQPMLFGGGQERGLRPGTENTPMIVGLGEAARLVNEHLATYAAQMRRTRDLLKEKLSALMTSITWLSEEPCLPNTLLVSIPEISSGKEFIESLDGQVLASTGAACHSGSVGSSVLNACGIDFEIQKRTIRFSTGRTTTEEQIERAVKLIGASLERLRVSSSTE